MFQQSGDAYDAFMGRYARPLAVAFADEAGVLAGQRALDVGCGPGALTGVLADRLGSGSVAAFDPSASFVDACASRHPGVDVRLGDAESIPFDDAAFDLVLGQLVLHFFADPVAAGAEVRRVARPGATVGACVWDFSEGMELLRFFWDAALELDTHAPDEARTMRFGREGEITAWLSEAGLVDTRETTLAVGASYADFDELWSSLLHGVGPAGSYCMGLDEDSRARLRGGLFQRVGQPSGSFSLRAVARCGLGTAPARG